MKHRRTTRVQRTVGVTLDEDVIQRIDRAAADLQVSRSMLMSSIVGIGLSPAVERLRAAQGDDEKGGA